MLLRGAKQVIKLLLDGAAEVGHLDQVGAKSNRVEWNMVSQTALILLHRAVLALELHHLVDEDLLVGEAEEELAVEFELGRHIQSAFDQLKRVFKELDGKVILLLQDDTVLRVSDIEANCQLEALKIDVDGNFARVDL